MKFLRALSLLAYWILAVAAIVYLVFWTPYRLELTGRESAASLNATIAEPPRYVDVETMRLLGRVSQSQVSHFVHFERGKPAGTIRVCALGDSHTRGDEVGERDDYPTLLQALFDYHGYGHIQVVNFGSSWHGFSQIYVMWKRVAAGFDCDFVLLLPMLFWDERDTTFNHSQRRDPGYLHARLIPDGDGLRLLAPLGETGTERRDDYLQAIPAPLYRRYDRHPISVVDALLPAEREIQSPFYYDPRSRRDEVRDIYPRIVRDIAAAGPQLVVLLSDFNRAFYPWLLAQAPDGVGVAMLTAPADFPYRAPAFHPSSWGNALVAEGFFRLLTGSADTRSIRVGAHDIVAGGSGVGQPRRLDGYTQARLEYGSDGRGLFVTAGNRTQGKTDQHLDILRREHIAALLALTPPGQGVAQGCLLPLAEVPAAGTELVFEPDGARAQARVIGRLRQLRPDVAVFEVAAPAPGVPRCPDSPDPDGWSQLGGDGRYLINGHPIAEISKRQLVAAQAEPLALRDDGGHHFDVRVPYEPVQVDLLLDCEDGSVLRRPLLRLEPRPFDPIEYRRHPLRQIRMVGGRAQIVAIYTPGVPASEPVSRVHP